jgi:hypothetical protein
VYLPGDSKTVTRNLAEADIQDTAGCPATFDQIEDPESKVERQKKMMDFGVAQLVLANCSYVILNKNQAEAKHTFEGGSTPIHQRNSDGRYALFNSCQHSATGCGNYRQ